VLVVLPVAESQTPLALLPAQRRDVREALHGRGEHLVDGERRLGGHAGLAHPQLHLAVALAGPEA